MCYLHSVTANFSQNNYTVILHWFLYALNLFFLGNKSSLFTERRSFDVMQNKIEYRTLLVSKSLPITRQIYASH